MIDSEIGESKGNAAKRALNKVQQSVEKGSFWQQYSAVLALRLTPVVPFRSISPKGDLSTDFGCRHLYTRSNYDL